MMSEGLTTIFRASFFAWCWKGSYATVQTHLLFQILVQGREHKRAVLRRDVVGFQRFWNGCRVQLALFQNEEQVCVEVAPSS